MIQNGVREGFILQRIETFVVFVDGPTDQHAHETYDWGKAVLQVLNNWRPTGNQPLYNWKRRMSGEVAESRLDAS
jgi:hypothetical protein